ncbi:MAG: bifunctional folylpolyglutamate synthase/dihydrofolate synthase [Candidatus Bathyarchaeia archaeon]
MNYEETLDWLYNIKRYGAERGLEPIRHLLMDLGNPQSSLRFIHVSGTNGKGSTSAMIASILRVQGYRVGLFTSPHLERFTERIKVDDEEISQEKVARIGSRIRPLVERMVGYDAPLLLRFFDVVTAMSLLHFHDEGVDFAVLEVGIGGELDATNVIDADVSVITNVGLEHEEILGETLLEIADKKAGIIKSGRILVTATKDEEVYKLFKERCERVGAQIFRVDKDLSYQKLSSSMEGQKLTIRGILQTYRNIKIPLLGEHQLRNATTAVGAIEALNLQGSDISCLAIKRGLSSVNWQGRLEIVRRSPIVVLDAAKDHKAAEALSTALKSEFSYDKLIFVVSISQDKHIEEMINNLAEVGDFFIITTHGVRERAADPSVIAEALRQNERQYQVITEVKQAISVALEFAGPDDLVCVTGSVFLVGKVRCILLGQSK